MFLGKQSSFECQKQILNALVGAATSIFLGFSHEKQTINYQARYVLFFHVRPYTQINVHLIKAYGTVPIAYGCTELRSHDDLFEAILT